MQAVAKEGEVIRTILSEKSSKVKLSGNDVHSVKALLSQKKYHAV